MEAVVAQELCFAYDTTGNCCPALNRVTATIHQGEFVAILGANGSGKSTLARHLNGLLVAQKGRLSVLNIEPSNPQAIWQLRRLCGMVFQNPENQFVSPIVAQDVAFGLENYGVPKQEIPHKVQAALEKVGMEEMQRRSPGSLSGGQKQRVAIAGVLAVEPDILIFDEATSMLDPEGRQEVLCCLRALHQAGKTVIMITHYVEEAVQAQRIFLMKSGEILRMGTAREILTNPLLLKRANLLPPLPVQLYYDLKEQGVFLRQCPLTDEELVEELCRLK